MTLLALSLSVGVVVDDAILVLENIYRRREHGEGKRTAALRRGARDQLRGHGGHVVHRGHLHPGRVHARAPSAGSSIQFGITVDGRRAAVAGHLPDDHADALLVLPERAAAEAAAAAGRTAGCSGRSSRSWSRAVLAGRPLGAGAAAAPADELADGHADAALRLGAARTPCGINGGSSRRASLLAASALLFVFGVDVPLPGGAGWAGVSRSSRSAASWCPARTRTASSSTSSARSAAASTTWTRCSRRGEKILREPEGPGDGRGGRRHVFRRRVDPARVADQRRHHVRPPGPPAEERDRGRRRDIIAEMRKEFGDDPRRAGGRARPLDAGLHADARLPGRFRRAGAGLGRR